MSCRESVMLVGALCAALLACKGGKSKSDGEPAAAAASGETKPAATSPAEAEKQAKREALIGKGPVPIIVTAKELNEAYKANEIAADEKYKGKRVWLIGNLRQHHHPARSPRRPPWRARVDGGQ